MPTKKTATEEVKKVSAQSTVEKVEPKTTEQKKPVEIAKPVEEIAQKVEGPKVLPTIGRIVDESKNANRPVYGCPRKCRTCSFYERFYANGIVYERCCTPDLKEPVKLAVNGTRVVDTDGCRFRKRI